MNSDTGIAPPWRVFLLAFLLATAAALPSWAAQRSTVVKDIPYPGASKGERRQSLDLYLPAKTAKPAPLVIFVHGGFWLLSDDQYQIGVNVAGALVREGVAVALLRYRLAGDAPHPAQAADVAAGVALLIRDSQKYGVDSRRIFLAGHSAGGHLAALVALDGSYLGKHGVTTKTLAGVVSFSAMYDLLPSWTVSENQQSATEKAFGKDAALLKQISPVTHARGDGPPFLVLTAQSDFPGFLQDAKRFTDAMNRAGQAKTERWIIGGTDHFSLLNLAEPLSEARLLVLEFLDVARPPPEYAMFIDAKRRWRHPPFSTLPFWQHGNLIKSYPVDRRLVERLTVIYDQLRYELQEWPLENYHAIDLFEYLDRLGADKIGRGDYLVTTNMRNEKQFWSRAQLAPYQPVIVVGLDDEKNLFRLGVMYRAQREYSWKSGPQPPMMARPLGGFIHFQKEPPAAMALQAAQFALTENSFRLVADDPLAGLRELPREIFDTMTVRNGCVYCHQFGAIPSRSHHIAAATGAAHGGEALALTSYPPEVWRSFVFDQVNAAKKIGASPNVIAEPARQGLFDLVNRERRSLAGKK